MAELSIMLVDDEVGFLRVTRKLLEKRGYRVETAADGAEALDKMSRQRFDVILLDVRMPGMDGIATLQKIKRDHPGVEVIMLTGHATVENAVEGIQLGASHYLMKPADINDIVDSIEISHARRQLIEIQTVSSSERLERARWPLFLAAAPLPLLSYLALVLVWFAKLDDVCLSLGAAQPSGGLSALVCLHRQAALATLTGILTLILLLIWLVTGRILKEIKQYVGQRERREFQRLHASKLASIGELAAGIAHEINNPLAIIVARCGIIRDLINPGFYPQLNPELVSAELDTICQASFRAKQVTRQLIDFGLRRQSPPTLSRVEVLLDEAFEEMLGHDEEPQRLTVIRNYAPGLPPIHLDAVRIRQVFLHLLNNAREAISGAGTITLGVRRAGEFIEVTVGDNGAGMGPEQVKSCFKPFFTTKKIGLATGLSLTIALSIVESHGGSIEVQSVPGAGSTFTVTLPVPGSGIMPEKAGSAE